jgi:hypothetical protein
MPAEAIAKAFGGGKATHLTARAAPELWWRYVQNSGFRPGKARP